MGKRTDKVTWLKIRDGGKEVYCERCGRAHPVDLPLAVDAFVMLARAHAEQHKYCREGDYAEPRRSDELSR